MTVALLGLPQDDNSGCMTGPACAPGVLHCEPGGLSTRSALDIIQNFRGRLIDDPKGTA